MNDIASTEKVLNPHENMQHLDIFEKTNLFKKERASRSKREKVVKETIKGWLFSVWPFAGYMLFSFVPFALSIYLSFCDLHVWNISNAVWVGFDNFIFLLFSSKSQFWWSMLQTLYYFLSLPIGIFIGLGTAVLLTSRIKLKKMFRTFLFIPGVTAIVGETMMWKLVFHRDYGIVNSIIKIFGGTPISWFTTPEVFMPLCILTCTWGAGAGNLLFQAALTQVNGSLIEAAQIDGANKRQVFFHVTLPAISPTTFYVLTMNSISKLQAMGAIQLFSQAGSTSGYGPMFTSGPFEGKYAGLTAVYYIYMMSIGGGTEGSGKSSAAGWILAMFIFALTKVNFVVGDKWVSYDN